MVERVAFMEDLAFCECDACRALPGTPPLCIGCLHNRAVIGALLAATEPKLNGARARAQALLDAKSRVSR